MVDFKKLMAKRRKKKIDDAPILNDEQQLVVAHTYGPLRVIATAGSGKTTALIERTVALVRRGVAKPSEVLLLSFSRAAQKEMEKRLSARMPQVDTSRMCRTFHSLGLDIFRTEADPDQSWRIDESGRLWQSALIQAMRRTGTRGGSRRDNDVNLSVLKRFASRAKSDMVVTPPALRRLGQIEPGMQVLAEALAKESSMTADDLISIFHAAEDMRERGEIEDDKGDTRPFVTFDDMVFMAAMLLRKPEVRERWAARWKIVMQDEAQDENEVQAEIAEQLCVGHRNYTVVGDPAQAIYSFRGARPEKIMAFEDHWPNAKTIVMHRNYRSGIDIVDAANRLIGFMPPSTALTDVQMHSERQTRAHVVAHRFVDRAAEAEAISKNCKLHHDAGIEWEDQAILVRMNWMTRAVEMKLARSHIPYKLVSGTSFFSLREVTMLYGYLRVATGRASDDDVSTTLMFPQRGLGKEFVKRVLSARDLAVANGNPNPEWYDCVRDCVVYANGRAREGVAQWLNAVALLKLDCSRLTPYQSLLKLKLNAGIDEWLKKKGAEDDEDNQSFANLEEALQFALDFSTTEELLDEVDRIIDHRKRSGRDAVTISTVHKAKGMEWPIVYVPCCEYDLFPSSRGDLNEERRLFYVACTRAQDELWMSCARFPEESKESIPSRFLDEIGATCVDESEFKPGRVIHPMKVGTQMALI